MASTESLKSLQVAIDTWNDDGGQWLDEADRMLLDAQRIAHDFAVRDSDFRRREALFAERERQLEQREQLLIEREKLLTEGMLQLNRGQQNSADEFTPVLSELVQHLEAMRTMLTPQSSPSTPVVVTASKPAETESNFAAAGTNNLDRNPVPNRSRNRRRR